MRVHTSDGPGGARHWIIGLGTLGPAERRGFSSVISEKPTHISRVFFPKTAPAIRSYPRLTPSESNTPVAAVPSLIQVSRPRSADVPRSSPLPAMVITQKQNPGFNQYFLPEEDLKYLPPYLRDVPETPNEVECQVSGTWPSWLHGTFVRCVPAATEVHCH